MMHRAGTYTGTARQRLPYWQALSAMMHRHTLPASVKGTGKPARTGTATGFASYVPTPAAPEAARLLLLLRAQDCHTPQNRARLHVYQRALRFHMAAPSLLPAGILEGSGAGSP